MLRKVKVKFGIRKGEYGPNARVEFPHPAYIIAIFQVTEIEEQKKYKFHYFNNVLVAKDNIDTLKNFLQNAAKKLNLEFEFVE
ncbi:MAG: hypothetical protein QW802_00845 [Candidatus Altiarchaeota archaeon]